MTIYNDVFGDYFIVNYNVNHYKVYRRKLCIKLDTYKEIRKGTNSLNEEDYNSYSTLVATKTNLLQSLMYIFESNSVYKQHSKDKMTVKGFYNILSEFSEFIKSIKTNEQ